MKTKKKPANVIADEKLKVLFGKDKVTMFEIAYKTLARKEV